MFGAVNSQTDGVRLSSFDPTPFPSIASTWSLSCRQVRRKCQESPGGRRHLAGSCQIWPTSTTLRHLRQRAFLSARPTVSLRETPATTFLHHVLGRERAPKEFQGSFVGALWLLLREDDIIRAERRTSDSCRARRSRSTWAACRQVAHPLAHRTLVPHVPLESAEIRASRACESVPTLDCVDSTNATDTRAIRSFIK
jgi:hypothetical protein